LIFAPGKKDLGDSPSFMLKLVNCSLGSAIWKRLSGKSVVCPKLNYYVFQSINAEMAWAHGLYGFISLLILLLIISKLYIPGFPFSFGFIPPL
jgi:intracellular septation protein A